MTWHKLNASLDCGAQSQSKGSSRLDAITILLSCSPARTHAITVETQMNFFFVLSRFLQIPDLSHGLPAVHARACSPGRAVRGASAQSVNESSSLIYCATASSAGEEVIGTIRAGLEAQLSGICYSTHNIKH